MAEFSEYKHGTFCWVDLGTTDAKGAKKFYKGLFGWDLVDTPAGPEMVYTMAYIDGKEVAALYNMGPQEQGLPPHWNSYVSVTSADDVAAKAKVLGGTVMGEPFDVFDAGRMALLQDPTGAVVAAWQPGVHPGAKLVNVPNTLCWNELATRDAKAAGNFYTQLFGWGSRVDQFGPTQYTSFMVGERFNGGMMQMDDQFPPDMPSHWLVYFAVADCDASAAKVTELGGQVLVGPTEAADVGRFAVVQDPQGGVFAIIKMNNPDS